MLAKQCHYRPLLIRGSAIISSCGLVMAVVCLCLRSGPVTREEIQFRSEPICRLFHAPGNPSDWTASVGETYENGNAHRRLWSVDCTTHEEDRARGQGAFVVWDAESGELCAISNKVAWDISVESRLSQSEVPKGTLRTAVEAAHSSQAWLERLRLQTPQDSWTLTRPPEKGTQSWQVRWHRRNQTCRMQIRSDSGDLVLLRIGKRPVKP